MGLGAGRAPTASCQVQRDRRPSAHPLTDLIGRTVRQCGNTFSNYLDIFAQSLGFVWYGWQFVRCPGM